jgi:hypothetical protein
VRRRMLHHVLRRQHLHAAGLAGRRAASRADIAGWGRAEPVGELFSRGARPP